MAEDDRTPRVEGVPSGRLPATLREDLSPKDGIVTSWFRGLYPNDHPPIPTATREEAHLIVAEAELDAGSTDAAAATITAVRTESGLPACGGGTAAEMSDQPIEERRRTLRLQSHRVGDMPEYGVPFRTGGDHKGRALPGETCRQLPFSEL